MTLKEAMDALGLSAPEVATLLDRPVQSVKQMRLDPDQANYRPAPDGWRHVLSRHARERGGELQEIADLLEVEAA